MPVTKSAKKALTSSRRKRVFNLKRRDRIVEVIKTIKKLVAAEKVDEAGKLVPQAYKALDKAAKRGVIKVNTAARKKSQLMKLFRVKN